MPPGDKFFPPPYLKYGTAAENQTIKDKVAAFSELAKKNHPREYLLHTASSAAANPLPAKLEGQFQSGPTDFGQVSQPTQALERTRLKPNLQKAQTPGPVVPAGSAGSRAKIAQVGYCTLTPSGSVTLGFNCRTRFTASTLLESYVTHTIWKLFMKNQATGNFDQIYFLGGISDLDQHGKDKASIEFEHDFSTYRDAAYSSTNKTAIFKVTVTAYLFAQQLATVESDPVTLDFNAKPCNAIQSLRLDPDSVTGSDNGNDPLLTITLEAPAGPGGEELELSVDDSSLGGILGPSRVLIPQGQQTDQRSGFVGTERVYTTGKSFNVVAQLKSPGGDSPKAYAKLTLTKKKR
jgi:hypothetical protein